MTFQNRSYNLWDKERPMDSISQPSNGSVGSSSNKDSEQDVSRTSADAEDDRGQWGNKAQFVLSCIGLSVGLGNVWRFPYLAFQMGGAAFVIAYLILQLLIGKPMYFMELVMGQFSGKGPTKVWDMNPSAKGIGVSMCIISLIVAIYYNVIMAYTLFYFFSSMQETLPWTVCTEDWINRYNCTQRYQPVLPSCNNSGMDINTSINSTIEECLCTGNLTLDTINCTQPVLNAATPAEIFFNREVAQKSQGVDPEYMGDPIWKLALCLLLSWIIVVFCLVKGIKTSGKVVYFTATFPYVILFILLIRGALLDGAIDGVKFFIVPEWRKLADLSVWVTAAGQMFFSLSVSFGGIIVFASYNKFNNSVYYDSLVVSSMDLVTSLISGFVVFTTFGAMAKSTGKKIQDFAKSGYGLAFIVYPEGLSNLPVPQLWSVLFFFMLFILGLDSEMGLIETVLTAIQDEFPSSRRFKGFIVAGLGIACYFMALACVCPGGDYVVTIMDHYGGDFAVLFLSCFEVVSVMWVYGVMRFMKDIEYMLGEKPHGWPYWVFCWAIACPVLIALMFIYRMVNYESPAYDNGVPFPSFAQAIGWVVLTIALAPVPAGFIWRFIRGIRSSEVTTFRELCAFMFNPTPEWGPNDGHDKSMLPDGAATTGHRTNVSQDSYDVEYAYQNPIVVSDKL